MLFEVVTGVGGIGVDIVGGWDIGGDWGVDRVDWGKELFGQGRGE